MTLLLHLTDLHLESEATPNVSSIIKVLPTDVTVNNCFIIFSGDFSRQALPEEMQSFDRLLSNIKNSIDKKYGVESAIVIVPGNHDITINGQDETETLGVLNLDNRGKKNLFLKQIRNELHAIEYCKGFGVDFSKSCVSYLTYDTEKTRFHFVLANSAPFSVLGSKEKDKGSHYLLPSDYPIRGNPEKGKNTVEILVSHHRPDWFMYGPKEALEEFENNVATFCFYGHEHTLSQRNVMVDYEGNTIISRGGELIVNKNDLTGSFAAFFLDDECRHCDIFKYAFDHKNNRFKKYTFRTNNLKTNSLFALKQRFLDETINPFLKDQVCERELFIMPLLKASGDQNNIADFDSLVDFIEEKQSILLYGTSKSGKSILLHRLFEEFSDKKWCIFLDAKKDFLANFHTAVKNVFEEQYKAAENTFSYFEDSTKEERVVIIDNFDSISKDYKKEDFLSFLKDFFGTIIIASVFKNESLGKIAKSFFNENETFNIAGFSIKQRIGFYEKYLNLRGVRSEEEIATISKAVDASVCACSIIDMSDPSYLLPLISQVFNNKLYLERNTQNAFSIIFETSIRNAILNVTDPDSLDDCISIIQLLASYIVFERDREYFDFSDISVCVKKKRESFDHIKLTDEDVLNTLVKSKLAYQDGNDYRFERNSYLAYFASLEVIRLYQTGKHDYFKNVIDNIVHGINGDIFVFSIYQLKNVNVFFQVHDTLDSLLKNFNEISFEKKNNPFLKLNKKLVPESKKQAENKKELFERLEKEDRKRIDDARGKERKAFEDDGDRKADAFNKITKLLEISCKVIAGFPNDIDSETRLLFLDKTLTAALKIVNLLFSIGSEEEIKEAEEIFEKRKKEWLEDAREKKIDERKIKKIEEIDLVHAFYDALTTFLLNYEASMARIICSRASLPVINRLEDSAFFKKLFKILAYCETGNFKAFCNQIEPIYSDQNNKEQILIINRIVRIFVITNGLNSDQCAVLSKITKLPQMKLLSYTSGKKEEQHKRQGN